MTGSCKAASFSDLWPTSPQTTITAAAWGSEYLEAKKLGVKAAAFKADFSNIEEVLRFGMQYM